MEQQTNILDSTNYNKADFKTEAIKQMVIKRNDLYIKYGQAVYQSLSTIYSKYLKPEHTLKTGECPSVRLIGNPHQPTMIINNSYIVSMFVNNFKVFLSTAFKDGKIMITYDLNNLYDEDGVLLENVEIPTEIEEQFDKLAVKYLWRLEDFSTTMAFSKYDKYGNAYFSYTNPQLFFTERDAINAKEELEETTKIFVELVNDSE